MGRVLCCWKRVFAMTSAFSWQNSLSLCFIPHSKAKFACYSRCFLTSYFCIPVPYNENYIFLVSVLKGLAGLHRTIQLQLLQHYWLGIDLDYCDIEWFALEMNRDHSIVFEIVSQYCISDSFVDHDGYSISYKGFLPTVVDIMI